jgi:hypothetical protein
MGEGRGEKGRERQGEMKYIDMEGLTKWSVWRWKGKGKGRVWGAKRRGGMIRL